MIRDLHNKLINQEITSEKLTEEYFTRIEEKDPEIKAYISLNKEFALDKARAVDKKIKAGEEVGLLGGIPSAIKDNMCIDGLPTTAGSKVLENYMNQDICAKEQNLGFGVSNAKVILTIQK